MVGAVTLFANRNIIENVISAPVKLLKTPRAEALEAGMELLTRIARAIAMHPIIILFDEPTSALDPTMIAEVLAMIRKLAKDGMTMLIVTHEMRFAEAVADRVVFLEGGVVLESAPPRQFFHAPQTERARQFLDTFEFDSVK